jgi:hypothetical protein
MDPTLDSLLVVKQWLDEQRHGMLTSSKLSHG